jgi:hypothetical protein
MLLGGHVVLLGSSAVLRNDHLAANGVAALDINAISGNRTVDRVVWLVPGPGATAGASRSVWQLFPSSVPRVVLALGVVAVLLVLWRSRRLGPVITEPLPVLVRAAELVEGHGRLYRRAGARDQAAAALRAGSKVRLAAHLGLPPAGAPDTLAEAVGARAGWEPNRVAALLGGPVPDDDATLVRLADDLDLLERASGVGGRVAGRHTMIKKDMIQESVMKESGP